MTLNVSRETIHHLSVYASLIRQWNRTINLVSAGLLDRIDAEIESSCELAGHVPSGAKIALDIGSGNGLPAVPISLVANLSYQLVESDIRKSAFLREVGRCTAAPITILNTRIEHLPVHRYDVITSRAFASLDELFRLAYPRQHADTVCIFPRGKRCQDELSRARDDWSFDAEQHEVPTGCNLVVRCLAPRIADK